MLSQWLKRWGTCLVAPSPDTPRRRKALRRRRYCPQLELLESRVVLSTVNWIGPVGGDGLWSTVANWVDATTGTNHLPGPADDAVINATGVTVTHAAGSDTIRSLTANDPFILAGGVLTVTGNATGDNVVEQNGNRFTLGAATLSGATVAAGTTILGTRTSPSGTLDGVTLNGVLDLATNSVAGVNVTGGMTLNGTIDIGAADGATYGTLAFSSSQAVSTTGSGSIVFGGSGFNSLVVPAGTTLTIDAGVTIDGQSGILGSGTPVWSQITLGGTLVNNGTIAADAAGAPSASTPPGTLTIVSAILTNTHALQVSKGETLNIGFAPPASTTAWSSSGTISVGNGTLNLNGTVDAFALGTFNRTGGAVNLAGTLNGNSDSGLVLDATTGPWTLAGGAINGGTITTSDDNTLRGGPGGNSGPGSLNGVTLNGVLDLATNNNATVNVTGGLTLNGTIDIGAANGSTFDALAFVGSQAVSTTSSASIIFGGSGFNSLVIPTGTTLTVNAGVTIDGQYGVIGTATPASSQTTTGGSLVNNGTIAADAAGAAVGTTPAGSLIFVGASLTNWAALEAGKGQTLSIGRGPTVADTIWTNGGTLSADGGVLNLNGKSWSNTGTISSVNNATVNLGSTFTLADLGTFSRTGGTVNLMGTLTNNSSAGLVLDGVTGPWNLLHGTINGGTITTKDSNTLRAVGRGDPGGDILNGVTLNGVLDLATTNVATVNVTGGLTLNGTIDVGAADGSTYGTLAFTGSQAVSTKGNGSIVFGGSGFNSLVIPAGTTLTINAGVTIDGQSGILGSATPVWSQITLGGTLVNNGTIAADAAGAPSASTPPGTLTIVSAILTNTQALQVSKGETLNIGMAPPASTTAWSSSGTISVGNGTLNLNGTVSTSDLGAFDRTGGTVNLAGTLNNNKPGLVLDDTTGSWTLAGGAINGGAITTSGSNTLRGGPGGNSGPGSLNGVTLNGVLDVAANKNATINVTGGLTLNGTIDIGAANGSTFDALAFVGSQAVSTTSAGNIIFGGSGFNSLVIPTGTTLTVNAGVTIDGQSGVIGTGTPASSQITLGGNLVNNGTMAADAGGALTVLGATNFSAATGTLTGGTWKVIGPSILRLIGANLVTNAATVLLDGAGARLYSDNGSTNALSGMNTNAATGTFTIQNGANLTAGAFSNQGSVVVGPDSTFTAPTFTNGGSLAGSGTVAANVTNNGQVSPGMSPGILNVTGNYTQGATGALNIEINGLSAGTQYDQLKISGSATLDGALNVIQAFQPSSGNSFLIIAFGSVSGDFATKNGLSAGGGLSLTPVYAPAANATSLSLTVSGGPVANPDALSTNVNTMLSLPLSSVLGNDTGTGLTPLVVSTTTNGTLVLNSGGLTYTPRTDFIGTDTFTYQDRDANGNLSNVVTDSIAVMPPAPVANPDQFTTGFKTPLTLKPADLLANDTGTGLTPLVVTTTTHGTLTGNKGGPFTYTPDAAFSGSDTFTYQDRDSAGQLSKVVTDTITVNPPAPLATADTFTTNFDTLLTVSVPGILKNDTGAGLTAQLVTTTANGTLTLAGDGSLTYKPDPAFSGSASFTYRDQDSAGQLSNLVTDTITVNPPVPVANADTFDTPSNTTLTVKAPGVLGNDSGTGLTAQVVNTTASGTLTVNRDGSLSYVPKHNFSGTDSFTYQDQDAAGQLSKAVADTITVSAPTPVANDDTVATSFNTTLSVAAPGVLANDTGIGLTAVLVTGAGNGAVTLHGDGSFTYVPATDFNGTDTFRYQDRDSAGVLTSVVTATITVNRPEPPVASAEAFSTTVSTPLAIPPVGGVLGNDTGTRLTALVASSTTHGSLTLASDGSLTYVPDNNFAGVDSFTYQDQDAAGQLSNVVTDTIAVLQPTQTGLTAPAAWVPGTTVVFTATVKPADPAAGTPTGQVIFIIDGAAQPPVTLAGAAASFSTSRLSSAADVVRASYLGDGNFAGSDSATLGKPSAIRIVASNPAPHLAQGTPFTGTVATFTTSTTRSAADFTAFIDWGDGTASRGTVAPAAGAAAAAQNRTVGALDKAARSFTVSGSHTYLKAGSFTAAVTVTAVDGGTASVAAAFVASVQHSVGLVLEASRGPQLGLLDVESFAWGEALPLNSSGQPTARVTRQDVRFGIRLSTASPLLFQAVANNQSFPQATFTFQNAGDPTFVTWTFTNVVLSSYRSAARVGGGLADEITLHFRSAAQEVRPLNPDGTLGQTVPASIDFQSASQSTLAPADAQPATAALPGSTGTISLALTGARWPAATPIDVQSFAWGEVLTLDASGRASGPVARQDVRFDIALGAASPLLFGAVANDLAFSQVVFTFQTGGSQPRTYETWTFKNVVLSSYSSAASAGGETVEELTLHFSAATQEYRPLNRDGTPGKPVPASVDFQSDRQSATAPAAATPPATSATEPGTISLALTGAKWPTATPIEVQSFAWGETRPLDASGRASGPVARQDVRFDIALGAASPLLFRAVATDLSFTRAVFTFQTGGSQPRTYETWIFTNAVLSSYSTAASAGGTVEELTLHFGTATQEYQPLNSDGGPGTPVRAAIDFTGAGASAIAPAAATPPAAAGATRTISLVLTGARWSAATPIEVQSLSWGEALPLDASGRPTGRGTRQDVRFDITLSAASPLLVQALATDLSIDRAVFTFQTGGSQPWVYATWTFTNAVLSSYSTAASAAGGTVEELTLHFGTATQLYRPLDSKGNPGTPVPATVNFTGTVASPIAPATATLPPASASAAGTISLLLTGARWPAATPIEVRSFVWGDAFPLDASGRPAGRLTRQDVRFDIALSAASPLLSQAVATDLSFTRAVFTFQTGGNQPRVYATWTFTNAILSSYSTAASTGGTGEQLTLHFGTVAEEYRPLNSDGSPGTPVPATIDFTSSGASPIAPAAATPPPASASAPGTISLKLTGPRWPAATPIEVLSFVWGEALPLDASGRPTGRVISQDVRFDIALSAASPLLFQAVATDLQFSQAVFTFQTGGNPPRVDATWTFQTVVLSSYRSVVIPGGGAREEITLHFGAVRATVPPAQS